MQLYVADYLGDTRHLTTEQHGAYLLLLMAMWRSDGRLANDAKKLARITGCTAARWTKISGDVLEFFEVDGDCITNRRLMYELKKAQEKSIKRSVSGTKGAEAKALKNNNADLAIASDLPKHSSDIRYQISDNNPVVTVARDAWREILDEATQAAGDALDPTSPGTLHAADLLSLLSPKTGEPCTQGEVIAAVGMVAARERRRGKKIRSWAWIREDALALRDKRLTSENPEVDTRQTGPPSGVGSIVDRMTADRNEAKQRVMNG